MTAEQSIKNRAIIHAYIAAHPGTGNEDIARAHPRIPEKSCRYLVRSLRRQNYTHMTGHGKAAVYTVIKDLPTEAEAKKMREARSKKSPDYVPKTARELRPGLHNDPNRMPIKGQGGQGNLRHSVRRGCSLS